MLLSPFCSLLASVTAVDTGWQTLELPVHHAARVAAEHNFQTPIDEVDAAARSEFAVQLQ